jgi:hypothetical protein
MVFMVSAFDQENFRAKLILSEWAYSIKVRLGLEAAPHDRFQMVVWQLAYIEVGPGQ